MLAKNLADGKPQHHNHHCCSSPLRCRDRNHKKRSATSVSWGCVLIWVWKNGYFLIFGFRYLRIGIGCLRKEKKRSGERRKKEEESWRKKKEKKEGRRKLRKKVEELRLEFLQATRDPHTWDATLQNSLQYLLTHDIVSNLMLNGKKTPQDL